MTAPLDLDALKAKALAATRGPWEVQTDKHPHFRGGSHTEHRIRTAWIHGQLKDHYPVITTSVGIPEFENGRPCRMVAISKEDADYIADANPAVMLELLARLELAEAGNAILRQQAEALHAIGHAIGVPAGEDVTKAVLPAVKLLVADANNQHSCHRDGDITFTMSMRVGDNLFRSGRNLNGQLLDGSVDEMPVIAVTAQGLYRDLKRHAAEGGAQ